MGGKTIATTDLIPSLTGYLKQASNLSPVYANSGRRIELGCDVFNYSYIDFHSADPFALYIADYSARIISYGGSSQVAGQGALSYNALSHSFFGLSLIHI